MKLFTRVRQAASVLVFGLPAPPPPHQSNEAISILMALVNGEEFKKAAVQFLSESGSGVGIALDKLGKVLLAILRPVAISLVEYTERETLLAKVELEQRAAVRAKSLEHDQKVDQMMYDDDAAAVAHRITLDEMRRKNEARVLELELMVQEKELMARIKAQSAENWVQDPIKVPGLGDKKTGN